MSPSTAVRSRRPAPAAGSRRPRPARARARSAARRSARRRRPPREPRAASSACSAAGPRAASSRVQRARTAGSRRRAQVELGERRAQVEAGAADHERPAAGVEQRVDLGVGAPRVGAGAEGLGRPARSRRGGARAARARWPSERPSGSRARRRPASASADTATGSSPSGAQARRQRERHVALADARGSEDRDHDRRRHAAEYGRGGSIVRRDARPRRHRPVDAARSLRRRGGGRGGRARRTGRRRLRPRRPVRLGRPPRRARDDARGRPGGARAQTADRLRRRRRARRRPGDRAGHRRGGVGRVAGRRARPTPSTPSSSRSTTRTDGGALTGHARPRRRRRRDPARRPVHLPHRPGPALPLRAHADASAPRRARLRALGRGAGATLLFLERRGATTEGAVGVRFDGRRDAAVRLAGRRADRPGADHHRRRAATSSPSSPASRRSPGCARRSRPSPTTERGLVDGGLLMGIVIDPNKPEYLQGDFLVRGLAGADPYSGRIVVGTDVRPGQVVRLHARDAVSADRDLREALGIRMRALGGRAARRRAGVRLQRSRRGDVRLPGPRRRRDRAASWPGAPAAGFFAAGRDRPGRRRVLPARLHRDGGGVRAVTGAGSARSGWSAARATGRGPRRARGPRHGRHVGSARDRAGARRARPPRRTASYGGARVARVRARRASGGLRPRRSGRGRSPDHGGRRASTCWWPTPASRPAAASTGSRSRTSTARWPSTCAPRWCSPSALAEGMAARGGGHIVFMSSMAGKAASPGGSLYSATKFGLRGFSHGLREDLRPRASVSRPSSRASSATRACTTTPASGCRPTSPRGRRRTSRRP